MKRRMIIMAFLLLSLFNISAEADMLMGNMTVFRVPKEWRAELERDEQWPNIYGIFPSSDFEGESLDRPFLELFDPIVYYNLYSDIRQEIGPDKDAMYHHFITNGVKEGRVASTEFNVYYYRTNYPDLQDAFGNDWAKYYEHYETYGRYEGREASFLLIEDGPYTSDIIDGLDYSLLFDSDFYYNQYPDLQEAFGPEKTSLLRHFMEHGMKEGRQASIHFNVYTYMKRYMDLRIAFGNDLELYYRHYIIHGKEEGRTAS